MSFTSRICAIIMSFMGIALTATTAQAAFFDLNAFYFQDSLDTGTETTNNRTLIDLGAGLDIDKNGRFVIGWSFSIFSYDLSDTNSTEVSTNEMGPKFGMYFGKDYNWGLFFTYNLISDASFSDGSDNLDWRGNTYKVEFGYSAQLTDHFFLGARINYYSATYDEQFDASNNFTEVERSLSFTYPSLHMSWRM